MELIDEGRTLNFPDRDQALECARSGRPDWIELGEVVPARPDSRQHHRWSTLRRTSRGEYAPSGLRWGGQPGGGRLP